MSLSTVRNGCARLSASHTLRVLTFAVAALGTAAGAALVRAEPNLVPNDGGDGPSVARVHRAVVPGVAADPQAGRQGGAMPRLSASLIAHPPFDFASPLVAWSSVTDRFGAPRAKGARHGGIDLALDGMPASPVLAPCAGTVVEAGNDAGYGNFVAIDCGSGWSTLVGHLSVIIVATGQRMDSGSPIGVSGSTGFSTGEHVHFEVRYLGALVNPEFVLDFHIPEGTPLSSGPIDDSLLEGEDMSAEPVVQAEAEVASTPTDAPAEPVSTPTPTGTATSAPSPTSTASASASPAPSPTPASTTVPQPTASPTASPTAVTSATAGPS